MTRYAAIETFNGRGPKRSRRTIRCDNREIVHVVGAVLFLIGLHVGDELPIGTPTRTAAAETGIGRDLLLHRGGLRIRDIYPHERIAVRVRRSIGRECDLGAVGRPLRISLVVLALRQSVQPLRIDFVQIDVTLAIGPQISLHILLESVSVDDDRLRRASGFRHICVRIRIPDHHRNSLGIRGPLITLETTLHLGELSRFATLQIDHPDLAAAVRSRAG